MKLKKLASFAAALCIVFQTLQVSGLSAAENKNEEGFIYGDIDGNGIADITDLSLLSQHLIKDITLEGNKLKAADTDGDNEVTLGDLANFRMFLSKLTSKLGPKDAPTLKLKPASDYSQVYDMLDTADEYSERDFVYAPTVDSSVNAPTADSAPGMSGPTESPTIPLPPIDVKDPADVNTDSDVSKDYSDTYNQEENVIEADIVKTDGKTIFTLNAGDDPVLNAVRAADGKFESGQSTKIEIKECGAGKPADIMAEDMYLYNDRIIVVGTAYLDNGNSDKSLPWYSRYTIPITFVSAYTKGDAENAPKLIDTYYQEGRYNEVRITPDGYMYLISAGRFTVNTSSKWDIPTAGSAGNGISKISADSIYIPEEYDGTYSRLYTLIGSVDLNNADEVKKSDVKLITGYTGNIYCSENNLYLTNNRYNYDFYKEADAEKNIEVPVYSTEITRVSLSEGNIRPDATAEVPGRIKDQFSMSEYSGNFRIATTAEYYTYNTDNKGFRYEKSNNVYVFDMNLKRTGELTHFAKDESVKSVSFAGDMAYVVTYVQTDPLFSIDLSDPAKPVILDEFKIDGYSTYMQKWDDNHLLGFGVSTYTNEFGGEVKDGYKLVMFDNSDPENLKEVGVFKLLQNDLGMLSLMTDIPESEISEELSYLYYYSGAEWERKELLIAPEKNLIGFPVDFHLMADNFDEKNSIFTQAQGSVYMFFSYENGEFKQKNYLGDNIDEKYYVSDSPYTYKRALYIGDYVYIVSEGKLMAADIETCTKTDEIKLFEEADDTEDNID